MADAPVFVDVSSDIQSTPPSTLDRETVESLISALLYYRSASPSHLRLLTWAIDALRGLLIEREAAVADAARLRGALVVLGRMQEEHVRYLSTLSVHPSDEAKGQKTDPAQAVTMKDDPPPCPPIDHSMRGFPYG